MIEINLVPDVKQELIHAQRVRLSVISLAVTASIIAVAVVVVLGLIYGGMKISSRVLDSQITEKSKRLSSVNDIDKTLTIQNQLAQIGPIHDSSHVTSRIFGVLVPISAQGAPNQIQYTNVTVDTAESVVTVQAQTSQYSGLDTFKKTLASTQFKYSTDGSSDSQEEPLASNIDVTSQNLSQTSEGGQAVTFTLKFTYPSELLSPTSKNAQIVTPTASNATDSYQGIPTSLFTEKTGGNK